MVVLNVLPETYKTMIPQIEMPEESQSTNHQQPVPSLLLSHKHYDPSITSRLPAVVGLRYVLDTT
jgi:hypothetical protein